MPRWLYFLLIFTVLTPLLNLLQLAPLLIFIIAALGILPLAALIGQSVEQVAEHTGERVGGLLFATFGNATELIIGIFALSEGLVDVVRASIIGSILGNALLVLGVSTCVGAFKHGRLRFETRPASQYASLLALCIGGLLLPAFAELLSSRTPQTQPPQLICGELLSQTAKQSQIAHCGVSLSVFIAVLLLLGYLASILFSVFRIGDKDSPETDAADEIREDFGPILGERSEAAIARLLAYRRHLARSPEHRKSGMLRQIDSTVQAIVEHEAEQRTEQQEGAKQDESSREAATEVEKPEAGKKQPEHKERKPNLWLALVLLTVATAGVALLSEILVGSIEPFTKTLGWNPAFVGLVFIPLIGGLPEYFNTINMALDRRIGMVLAASAGSSIQIALLVAPILVLVSLLAPKQLDLVFSVVELAVLGLATFLFSEITKDGELVWLEGLLLILLYAIMGGTVFLFGA